jgi:hypothetical protein
MPTALERLMPSSKTDQEKLEELLKQELGFQLLNQKILELSDAYHKKKDSKTLQALTTAMGMVNTLCEKELGALKEPVVSMTPKPEEDDPVKQRQAAFDALVGAYRSNLERIKAIPQNAQDSLKQKALLTLVGQLLAKPQKPKRSRVPVSQEAKSKKARGKRSRVTQDAVEPATAQDSTTPKRRSIFALPSTRSRPTPGSGR